MSMRIVLHLFFFLALLFAPVRAKYLNVTVNNTDPSIQFSSGWSSWTASGSDGAYYGGTANCTNVNGASATFTFTGVAVYYIAPLFDENVTTVLELDSKQLTVVDLTEAQGLSSDWTVRWGASGLNNGTHTLVNYGPSDTTTPSGNWGVVNAFIYTVAQPDPTVQPNPAVQQHPNIAAIVGGAVASAVALALMALACWIFRQNLEDWLRDLAFFVFGWFFFKRRRVVLISDVLHETQITLFLTPTPGLPGSASQAQSSGDSADEVLRWKVLEIGPAKRQEVVHLPSTGRTGVPGLVLCRLNAVGNGFEALETSPGAASDFIHTGEAYEWVPSDRPGISVRNQAPHDDLFALATLFDDGSANPFRTFTLPKNESREFTGGIYLHAFRTTGATPGSRPDFSDHEFLLNRITEENGCEVSKLGPVTYWYIYEDGNRLKVDIRKSRKKIKGYGHQLTSKV